MGTLWHKTVITASCRAEPLARCDALEELLMSNRSIALLLVAFALPVSFTLSQPVRADVVTEWNAAALSAVRVSGTPPPVASRSLAILHAAIYDAVNGISRTHEVYLVDSSVPASASPIAAASAAAHTTLVALFPAESAAFDSLHAASLATVTDGPRKNAGIQWGTFVANEILQARSNDGANALVPPPSASGPGFWQPTPPRFAPYLLPQWGFVTPFAIASAAAFRPPPPPSLDSTAWAADYNEVKSLGAATGSQRTADQEQIALFWADGTGTETPPGHWNHIAQSVAASHGNSVEENARLFALLNVAMADAAICVWDAKYVYDFWRPVTAIRAGDLDGNPATEPDPMWSSFIVTPPFPDYVSGHSAFSGAAAAVLAQFYGSDDFAFTTGSDFLPGIERTFSKFSAAAAEAAASRVYGGIHFRSASQAGLTAGHDIGDFVMTRFLLAKNDRSRN